MSRLHYMDHVAVFKFRETGLGEAVLEAADYIRDGGIDLDNTDVRYGNDPDGNHYIEFWPKSEG